MLPFLLLVGCPKTPQPPISPDFDANIKACDTGKAEACSWLGGFYDTREGNGHDALAVQFYGMACDRGEMSRCARLYLKVVESAL